MNQARIRLSCEMNLSPHLSLTFCVPGLQSTSTCTAVPNHSAPHEGERTVLSGESLSQSLLHASLIDASVDGILAFDRECRYVAWNRAMESISGVSRDEVLGKCAFDVFPFLKETGEAKYLLEALAGRSVVTENRPYAIPRDGTRRIL